MKSRQEKMWDVYCALNASGMSCDDAMRDVVVVVEYFDAHCPREDVPAPDPVRAAAVAFVDARAGYFKRLGMVENRALCNLSEPFEASLLNLVDAVAASRGAGVADHGINETELVPNTVADATRDALHDGLIKACDKRVKNIQARHRKWREDQTRLLEIAVRDRDAASAELFALREKAKREQDALREKLNDVSAALRPFAKCVNYPDAEKGLVFTVDRDAATNDHFVAAHWAITLLDGRAEAHTEAGPR